MGHFAAIELALHCETPGWPTTEAGLAAVEANYHKRCDAERQLLNGWAGDRHVELEHTMLRTRKVWARLSEEHARHLARGNYRGAAITQRAADSAWHIYEDARQAYEAWLPCYEEEQ